MLYQSRRSPVFKSLNFRDDYHSAEVKKFVAHGREFLTAAVEIIFRKEWHKISLVDEISNEPVANALREASECFSRGDFLNTLIGCRKAFYELFEKDCDISVCLEEDKYPIGLLSKSARCNAPHYAKNREYIERNVKTPFDFIVLDHQALDSKLLRDGLDPQVFWNIWRLTPKVYRRSESEWIVAEENDIHLNPDLRMDAEYVLEATIDLAVRLELRRKGERLKSSSNPYWVLRQTSPDTSVYEKASKNSKVTGSLPERIKQILSLGKASGLDGDGSYWNVMHIEKDFFVFGYVHENDMDLVTVGPVGAILKRPEENEPTSDGSSTA